MKETFFRCMTWLHTWSGLLVCWLLFLVFFAGTAAYYRSEISLWMQPEVHQAVPNSPLLTEKALSEALTQLEQKAPGKNWSITLPSDRLPVMSYSWSDNQRGGGGRRGGGGNRYFLDPVTAEPLPAPRATRGGDFLYRLHFDLHYMSAITGRWIVGFCTMFMLLAIISGIVIHKRIFKDFFSFRPGKGPRTWLDGHAASAVLSLPYHLMITYTGLITLMFVYMPWGVQSSYGNSEAFFNDWNSSSEVVKASGEAAPFVSTEILTQQLQALMQQQTLRFLRIEHAGDRHARIIITPQLSRALTAGRPPIILDGVTGEILQQGPAVASGGREAQNLMISLHTGRFAAPWLRFLFFIAGVSGCFMIATGAMMWATKLRQKLKGETSVGLWLVDKLNAGTFAGLPIGLACYFYANRLIPASLPQRADWEIDSLFAGWAVITLLMLFSSSRKAWARMFMLTAALYALLPLLNAWTSGFHLFNNFSRQHYPLAGFDLMLLVIAAGYAIAGYRLRNKAIAEVALTRKEVLA